MIITCPSCTARFAVKSEAIGYTGRKVRCAKCKHDWFQDPTEESLAEIAATLPQEPASDTAIPDGSNLPIPTPAVAKSALPLKLGFAFACVVFIVTLSIVSSSKVLPHMGWYYSMFGIHDDAGVSLYNVSAAKVDNGEKKELLVKGRIVNESKTEKSIPSVRITLLGEGNKKLRTVMRDSHEKALAPGEGIDFETRISSLPDALASVAMDIGNSVNLAAR